MFSMQKRATALNFRQFECGAAVILHARGPEIRLARSLRDRHSSNEQLLDSSRDS